MILCDDDKAVLAHVVVDPQAWVDHALEKFGEEAAAKHLAAKVAKHRPSYEGAVKDPDYQTRAERDAEQGP